MDENQEKLDTMTGLIMDHQISKVKSLVDKGIDIHYGDDYFLYLAAFSRNEELQKYFIEIGLDPETTQSRLAIAHPEELEKLRKYKNEKEIREHAQILEQSLSKKEERNLKIKI